MQSTIRGNLIFDFDYTLAVVPSSDIQRCEIIQKYCDLSKEQLLKTMSEINSDFGFVNSVLSDSEQIRSAYNKILELNFYLAHYVYILPSLQNEIKKLSKHFNLYVYSGRDSKSLVFAMEKIELKDFFIEIRGSNKNESHKPNPKIVNTLISKYHMQLNDTIYIGDKEVDKKLANNIGCGFVQAKWYRWYDVPNTNICYNPQLIEDCIIQELKVLSHSL